VIAFATALIVALLGDLAIVLYSKRRAPGTYLTWAEAMAASIFAFLMFNLWYGVIPHQWLTMANAEWNWSADRIFYGPLDLFEPHRFIPFTVTYVALRDIVVVLIYGLALTLPVNHWAPWNDRAKAKPEIVPTTTYGRPLARKS
jgi:hypothetical protein